MSTVRSKSVPSRKPHQPLGAHVELPCVCSRLSSNIHHLVTIFSFICHLHPSSSIIVMASNQYSITQSSSVIIVTLLQTMRCPACSPPNPHNSSTIIISSQSSSSSIIVMASIQYSIIIIRNHGNITYKPRRCQLVGRRTRSQLSPLLPKTQALHLKYTKKQNKIKTKQNKKTCNV